jgi:phage protein U
MSNPLLALGHHTFEIGPLNYQELSREVELRWAVMKRLGAEPVYQAVGVGEVPMSISGLLFPEAIGGWDEYQALEATARLMQPVMMIGGTGQVFGLVVITRVGQVHKHITAGGLPRMIEFSIDVKKQGSGFSA